jgi:toxin ParE1/3/4
MREAEFHPAARREFHRAMDDYEDEKRGLGRRFQAEIERRDRQIERDQMAGFSSELNTRTVLAHRFPYKIVFGVFAGILWIVAVAHTRRHPDYWHARVKDMDN